MSISRPPGVSVEALGGDSFAAFSPLSWESHLVNAEAALVLGLVPAAPLAEHDLIERVAAAAEVNASVAAEQLHDAWVTLVAAGLLRRHADSTTTG